MVVQDSIPEGAPKGYLKVYYLVEEGDMPQGVDVSVDSTDNMDAPLNPPRDLYGRKIGWTSDGFLVRNPITGDNERGWLIAKKPGLYKYVFTAKITRKMGDKWLLLPPQVSDFKILVQEGMVAPVKLIFRDVRIYVSPSKNYVWQPPIIVVEPPIPFKK